MRLSRYSTRSLGECDLFLLLLRLEDPGDILCDFLELGEGERLRPGDKSFLDMELFLLVGERLVL